MMETDDKLPKPSGRLRTVIHGNASERVSAILKFAIWFAAASFIASTLLLYVGSIENAWVSASIGAVVSGLMYQTHQRGAR